MKQALTIMALSLIAISCSRREAATSGPSAVAQAAPTKA